MPPSVAREVAIREACEPEQRIELLDVLRGCALYGVLLANLVWFTDITLPSATAAQLPTARLDAWVSRLVVLFVDGKFITLFSFLFGVGFALQMERARARGARPGRTYARRMVVLLLIGALHTVLLWFGDILLLYAVGGLALLALRRWKPARGMLVAAVLLIVFTTTVFLGLKRLLVAPVVPAPDSGTSWVTQLGGTYSQVVRANVSYAHTELLGRGMVLVLVPQILGRFLLGLYAGRRRLIQGVDQHVGLVRRVAPWLLVFGLLGGGLEVVRESAKGALGWTATSGWMLATDWLVEAGLLSLAACYACAVVLLMQRPAWRRRLAHLAPVGRMALTNYLSHSVFYLFVLTGAGCGLLGRIGPTLCVAWSVAIFALQIVLSAWWLRRFRFGPAEWLWRSLTYGRLQPMRLVSG